MSNSHIIPLAWPETKVRKVGMWYDPILSLAGFNDGTHYKVGHAAFLLINKKNGNVHYFDFGRYHTPKKHGRVRDSITDPELTIKTKAVFDSNNYIDNISEILSEIASNRATHGSGYMLASVYTGISFDKSFAKAKEFQNRGAIPYGPLDLKGTNCSRFVASVAKAGNPDLYTKLLISFPYTASPTPISNIKIINSNHYYYKAEKNGLVYQIEYNFIKPKRNFTPRLNAS